MTRTAIDSMLINRLLRGEESAFEQLVKHCSKELFHFAHTYCKDRGLAEEIVQEAFVQLWINREKLSPNLPLYPYLFTQVRRMTIDAFRKKLLQERYAEEHQKTVSIAIEDTAETVYWRELNSLTEIAIRQLPEHQQRVFEMSRIQGLSYDEIAKQLQISRNTVKYHLVNALKNLRKTLIRYGISSLILISFFAD